MRGLFTLTVLGMCFANPGICQVATPEQRAGLTNTAGFGTMHFQTRLGSCKIIDGKGRLEMNFRGSVLINKLKGTSTFTGNVRKEYSKDGREVWNGQGKVVVTGEWRGIQWFGRDLTAVWFGAGMVRLSGEFDRNQKTGEYWYDDPANIHYWPGSGSIDLPCPENRAGFNPNVNVKKKGK